MAKGYAERDYDLPDWVAGNLIIHAEWKHREAFRAGMIAVEWCRPEDGSKAWWRFCPKRLNAAMEGDR